MGKADFFNAYAKQDESLPLFTPYLEVTSTEEVCVNNTKNTLTQFFCNKFWSVCIWVFILIQQMWPTAVLTFAEHDNVYIPSTCIVTISSITIFYWAYKFSKVLYRKIFYPRDDTARIFWLGEDYWVPLPQFSWGQEELLEYNVAEWSYEHGWDEFLDSQQEHTIGVSTSKLCMCVCYLLVDGSNGFLWESMNYYTKKFTCPIYVMMNVKNVNEFHNIDETVSKLKNAMAQKYNGQVQIYFVKNSHSKAENQNEFARVVDSKYDYTIIYDIDDRPVYTEQSLILFADQIIGLKRNSFTIGAIQGPCLETYNDSHWGFIEAYEEVIAQTRELNSGFRLDGYIFSQGSNILVETSILKEVLFDEKFLAEDMRWSLEIMDQKMVTIHYCPSMISYGQTPTPFNNIYKRRRRWNKGRYQCKLYTVFNISPFKLPSYIDYLFQAIIEPFIIIPILWYLWVFGFWVLHSEFKNQWFFYINVNHPIIWICYPLFILMVFGNLVYCIQTLLHVSETDWLNNGRSSRIKDFGRIVYGIWSDWIGFFPIVTYNFWLIKYHESEMFIEWMLCVMSNQWDPTPKVSKTKSVDDEFF